MLQSLSIRDTDWDEVNTGECYSALAELPALDCLRCFTLGPADGECHINGEGIVPVIAKMTRLEELYLYAHYVEIDRVFALPMPYLRILHVYHLTKYPLEVLAYNPTLTNLTTLECYPHMLEPGDNQAYIQPENFLPLVYSPHLKKLTHLQINQSDIGDEGARAIVESGILKQLRVLNLDNGCITDAGALLLAGCPDLRRLEQLRIRGNMLTHKSVAVLNAIGVPLSYLADQHDPDLIDMPYLWEGDME